MNLVGGLSVVFTVRLLVENQLFIKLICILVNVDC